LRAGRKTWQQRRELRRECVTQRIVRPQREEQAMESLAVQGCTRPAMAR
jgi:hypothetical protein